MINKRLHLFIEGRVQGVFYRDSTRRMAHDLGLPGWVRNLSDGRVEAVFEGPEDLLNQALTWCYQGSPSARVDRIEIDWAEPIEGLTQFKVRY